MPSLCPQLTVRIVVGFLWAVLAGWSQAPAGELATASDPDTGLIRVTNGDRLLLQYQSTPAPYKVYVKQLTSPAGRQVLRDSPHDHVHHHALMYAIGADGVDFWGEAPGAKPGRQVPRGDTLLEVSGAEGSQQARIRQTIDWIDSNDSRLLAEQREIVVREGVVAGASLVEWKSCFSPGAGKEKADLWGRHYFGLGMRFVESMDGVATFINSAEAAGEPVRGSERMVRADWCALTGPVDGTPVTVAMFGHPQNPRHPVTWFTMTQSFAYLSATLDLDKEPLTIEAGKPLALTYAVVVWDGRIERDEIQRAYDQWLRANP
jgi:hypothetical protein